MKKRDDFDIKREALTYRQSVAALVVNANKNILLVQKKNYNYNEWDFPGGGVHLDMGENVEAAIARELEEELGTKDFEVVNKSKHVDQYEWPTSVIISELEKKGRTYRGTRRVQFLVKIGNERSIATSSDEIKAIKWVSVNDLQKYMVFPNQLTNAQKLIKEFSL